jgi:hypothetical protein
LNCLAPGAPFQLTDDCRFGSILAQMLEEGTYYASNPHLLTIAPTTVDNRTIAMFLRTLSTRTGCSATPVLISARSATRSLAQSARTRSCGSVKENLPILMLAIGLALKSASTKALAGHFA